MIGRERGRGDRERERGRGDRREGEVIGRER